MEPTDPFTFPHFLMRQTPSHELSMIYFFFMEDCWGNKIIKKFAVPKTSNDDQKSSSGMKIDVNTLAHINCKI